MRNLTLLSLHRQFHLEKKIFGDGGDEVTGVFMFRSKVDQGVLRVIAASGEGWDHVSVSRTDRIPTWDEMCQIKDLFFREDEYAVQYHPKKADYVNCHPYVLHLWRDHGGKMPFPPKEFV